MSSRCGSGEPGFCLRTRANQSGPGLPHPPAPRPGSHKLVAMQDYDAQETRLGVNAIRDGFPNGVAVALGLLATFVLAFFAVVVFGGIP